MQNKRYRQKLCEFFIIINFCNPAADPPSIGQTSSRTSPTWSQFEATIIQYKTIESDAYGEGTYSVGKPSTIRYHARGPLAPSSQHGPKAPQVHPGVFSPRQQD